MPIASVSDVPERFELKTLPEAYVTIRRMSYAEKLKRIDEATQQEMTGQQGKRDSVKVLVQTLNLKITKMDFANCIVSHNLEWADKDGHIHLFDFKNDPSCLDRLDPRIAEEINKYIDEVNSFNEDDEEMLKAGKEALTSDSSMS